MCSTRRPERELSASGMQHSCDRGPRRAALAADSLVQPCADSIAELPSTSTDALLADRCLSDVAPFHTIPLEPPMLRRPLRASSRVAVVTVAHRPRSTARFLTPDQVDNATDVLPCATILQSLALREIGGFGVEVDHVLVHSNWLPEQLQTVAAHGIKLSMGSIPAAEAYGSEFEAANMLKIEVAGLTQYRRVLFIDLDMLPRERATQYLEWEYPEGLVGFPSPTTPISGQLFVLRPDAKMHRLLTQLAADRANFSVARGWANGGLLTWPDVDARSPRAQCNSSAMSRGAHVDPARGKRRRCALWPFWIARCRQHRLTNWNFIHAGSDQGILWYAYNLSGWSSLRALQNKPRGPNGEALLLGLPFWVHLQGMCKPWLATRETLARAKCLRSNAFFFHGVWDRFREAKGLDRTCPTFAAAFERFRKVAPPEARKPCFWGGAVSCFERYRPAWVVDG